MQKAISLRKILNSLPTRQRSSHKASAGKCLLIAGSNRYLGAAVLAATAASRVGAGYVFLKTGTKFQVEKNPDFLVAPRLSLDTLKSFGSIGFGPGWTDKKSANRWLTDLKKIKKNKVVLDAGALDLMVGKGKVTHVPPTWILTPHEGELGRMLSVESELVRKDRRGWALAAQKKFGCVVVLKGHNTIVCDSSYIYINKSGNPALSKAGTGDVLCGMIAGLLAQGLESFEATCLAVYIHGKTAEEWIGMKNDVLSLMPSDLLLLLPKVLSKIRKKSCGWVLKKN